MHVLMSRVKMEKFSMSFVAKDNVGKLLLLACGPNGLALIYFLGRDFKL